MQASQQATFVDCAMSSELTVEDIKKSLKAMSHYDLLSYATNVNNKLDELYKVVPHELSLENPQPIVFVQEARHDYITFGREGNIAALHERLTHQFALLHRQ